MRIHVVWTFLLSADEAFVFSGRPQVWRQIWLNRHTADDCPLTRALRRLPHEPLPDTSLSFSDLTRRDATALSQIAKDQLRNIGFRILSAESGRAKRVRVPSPYGGFCYFDSISALARAKNISVKQLKAEGGYECID